MTALIVFLSIGFIASAVIGCILANHTYNKKKIFNNHRNTSG